MMNKKISLMLMVLSTCVYALDESSIKNTIETLKNKEKVERTNQILEKNKIQEKYTFKTNLPQFQVKENKEIHLYVRDTYKILENDYVVKTPSQWVTILVKERNIWETY